jgi:sugar phosphate isomerase/epimerase
MKRRNFIQTSVVAGFAAAHSPAAWARWAEAGASGGAGSEDAALKGRRYINISEEAVDASRAEDDHRIQRVGLQLYTVRDLMKKDFDGTLAHVAQIGYKEVEFAGYYGRTAQQARALLDKDGLTSPSVHVPYEILESNLNEALESAHVIGQSFIVCPWIDVKQRTADGWKRAAEMFNRTGEATHKAGVQFAYHNHAFEFAPAEGLGGKLPYDFLLAETDPKLVKMEMDLCWITVGGGDPVKYFDQYPGRFPLVHVKDWSEKGPAVSPGEAAGPNAKKGHIVDVGQGEVNFKRIFEHSEKAGIQHYIVENDEPKSPYEDLKTCYEYLVGIRF